MIDLLLSSLGRGRKHARSRKRLARELGVDDRTLRDIVHRARRDGYPILSDTDTSGYYLPDEQTGIADAERFIASQRSRIKKINESITGALRYTMGGDQQNPYQHP